MAKIKAGEEITINYFGSDSLMGMLFKKWRRDIFLSELPFDCKCELCEKGKYVPKFVFLLVKFIYSEEATKFCEIFTLLLSVCTAGKSKVKISHNFVAFSEYMNFINQGGEIRCT